MEEKKEKGPDGMPGKEDNEAGLTHAAKKKKFSLKKDKTGQEEELRARVEELNDKYLRLFAEFDNYRKRSLKERAEHSVLASADLILALLPVLDDFDRAMKTIPEPEKATAVVEGFGLIQAKMRNILFQKGLEEIKATGEVFNTDFHDAITHIPSPTEEMKGRVFEEVEKGYLLKGKVLRYSKVVVCG